MADRRSKGFGADRIFLYAVLLGLALLFLLPVYVMVVNSVKPLDEIRSGNLMALPIAWTIEPWLTAWSTAQIGVQPTGLRPYFYNSFLLVVPAVAISTLIGALNGYILTQFRFRGANLLFAAMLFSVFIPFQIVLIPMAKTLGILGLAGTVKGLIFVNVVYGIGFTTLFFRNYYAAFPNELIRSARIDGLAVHQHLERIPVRRLVQRLQLVPDHRGAEQPGQQFHRGQGVQRPFRRGLHRGSPDAGRLPGFRKILRPRLDGRFRQRVNAWLRWI